MTFLGLSLVVTTTAFPAFQMFMLPNVTDQIALFSHYLGLAALVLMAWGQILATRLPGLEAIFGGLDRIYVLHKWAGIAAMGAILLHDTIDAEIRGLGAETTLTELAETLGEISLYGLLILVVVSVATFIPYHLWKWTHKAMGGFFALSAFHFFFIIKPFAMTDPAGLFTGFFCLAGLAAYGWTLLPEAMRPSRGYVISRLDDTGGALAITMTPTQKPLRPTPGQFGVLSFTGANRPEPHPFSFSQIGADGSLRVTVKALGDFTAGLRGAVRVGQAVRIQGPFGRFRRAGKGPEVWIAGGIGITPFLAWAETLEADSGPVHLFYCVRSAKDAPHLDEIERYAAARPSLSLKVFASADGARLTADAVAEAVGPDLASARVSFCGPAALREAMQTGLRRYGVSGRRFQYEEFEFRTGVGLTKLALWILERARTQAARRQAS